MQPGPKRVAGHAARVSQPHAFPPRRPSLGLRVSEASVTREAAPASGRPLSTAQDRSSQCRGASGQ
jgi:hypothetical protein